MTESNGSFDDFVQSASGSLLGYGRSLTGADHEAWDLVQEALTRMGERWSRQTFEDAEAYARRVMVRLNVDRFRRIRRDVEVCSTRSSSWQLRDAGR